MKKALLAGSLALAVALPTGWAMAQPKVPSVASPRAPKAPKTHPRVNVGRVHRSVKVGNTTVGAKTRRTRAGARPNRTARTGKTGTPTGGGLLRISNPAVGGLRLGTRKKANGHSRARLRGNVKGTPIRVGSGL